LLLLLFLLFVVVAAAVVCCVAGVVCCLDVVVCCLTVLLFVVFCFLCLSLLQCRRRTESVVPYVLRDTCDSMDALSEYPKIFDLKMLKKGVSQE